MFIEPVPFIPFTIDYIVSKYDISEPIQKQKALKWSKWIFKKFIFIKSRWI